MGPRLKTPPKVALPPVETNKFLLRPDYGGHVTEFFHLLMTIERRHAAGKPKQKKIQKTKVAEIGSLNCGPYFFLDKVVKWEVIPILHAIH